MKNELSLGDALRICKISAPSSTVPDTSCVWYWKDPKSEKKKKKKNPSEGIGGQVFGQSEGEGGPWVTEPVAWFSLGKQRRLHHVVDL